MKRHTRHIVALIAVATVCLLAASCGTSRSSERMYPRKQTNAPQKVKSSYSISGSSRVEGTDQNLRRKTY
ncbi:MAG: hypothetical protein K5650_04500 [Bacteroidales bacterium]|nr:hypothetical protein [Bacteroidales bacterium]